MRGALRRAGRKRELPDRRTALACLADRARRRVPQVLGLSGDLGHTPECLSDGHMSHLDALHEKTRGASFRRGKRESADRTRPAASDVPPRPGAGPLRG